MAEAQESSENTSDEIHNDGGNIKCLKCREVLTVDKNPKLLHCLHSFCDACLQKYSNQKKANPESEEKSGSGQGNPATASNIKQPEPEVSSTGEDKTCCPECNVVYSEKDVISNPFIHITAVTDANNEDGSPSTEKYPICTSCDENEKAASFCVECSEWLCDPCVIAHKRVKLTKDHTISTDVKAADGKSGLGESKQRQIFCQTHKTETLKLYCLTCETLTCRDCQLNDHKDHKYQYIEQTIEEQKQALVEGINELKKRLVVNQEMAQKITDKESSITKQQQQVFNEVRQVAYVVTQDLISWCKRLLTLLQSLCVGRIKDLAVKKNEVATFEQKATNTIKFVESALESGDDLSVLLAKNFMAKSINSLKEQTISFQNSMLDFNVKYEHDSKFLLKHDSKMGFINVNGKSYPHNPQEQAPPSTTPTPPPLTAAPSVTTSAAQSNQSKENFVADLIKQQPLHVQEKYRSLPVEHKRMFVGHMLEKMKGQRSQQPPPPNLTVGNQRQGGYSSDSSAIRDWYSRPPRPASGPRPYLYQQQQMPPQQQQLRPGTFQPQQYRPGGMPMVNWTGNQQMPIGMGGHQRGQAPPGLIPADKLPAGRFDIDPLNLRGGSAEPVRVKQEPRDRDFSSCQLSESQNNTTNNRRIQSPSTSTTGIPQSPNHTPSHTPGHTPSPSHSDGGSLLPAPSLLTSAMPDINLMDTDRNVLLQGLAHPSGQKINAYHLHPKHDPSDPSEDYCGVCHNGGDLLCCDNCPKVFHLQCHVPFINTNITSNEQWSCTLCIPDNELIIRSPLPRETENSSGKRKAANGLLDKEIKVCERILLELFCLEISSVFHEPVPKSVPNYHKIILNPMDLSTIKSKLRRGHFAHYNTINDFISDVNLVFKNCFKFNQPTSDVFAVGKSVKNYFENRVQHFLPCYYEFMKADMETPLPTAENNSIDGTRNGEVLRQILLEKAAALISLFDR